jgi:hypothetical protein
LAPAGAKRPGWSRDRRSSGRCRKSHKTPSWPVNQQSARNDDN